jgi:alkaline phosphatase D
MPAAFPDGDLDQVAELGAIDERGVRVWLRDTTAPTVPLRLTVEGHPAIEADVCLSAETDWTGARTLSLPESAPCAPFTLTAGSHQLGGRLAPAPSAHTGLTFGFGSCNRPFLPAPGDRIILSPAAGLYRAMATDLQRRQANFLLLAGDQVYSDELEPVSVRNGLGGDTQHPPPFDDVLAAYRRVSRGFLGESGFRALRAAFPTYCIWDDHDIFNCWGSRLTKTPLDRRLFEAACRAYGEYQHTRNPDGAIAPPPYNYSFRWGDIGFLVLDLRGARDWERGRLLGQEQWQAVRAYLAGEDARTVHTLFVVASIPVAHVSRWVAKLFDRVPGRNGAAVRDRWCSAQFIASRDELLDDLFTWQTARPERQAIVLSGDVHCASAFTIRQRGGRGVIQQFTSSALTTPDPWTARTVNRVAVRLPNLFEPRFAFQRRLLSFLNNFGVVEAVPLEDGGHRVSFTVRAWRPDRHRLVTAGRMVTTPDMH